MKKIAVISFDYYSYDSFIVKTLNTMDGIEAVHIDYSDIKYGYKNYLEKIKNFYLKNFKGRNIKKEYIENEIVNRLKNNYFDDILIMRPDRLSMGLLEKIKQKCSTLICYLYDSSHRFDIEKYITSNLFNRIYTFDKKDAEKYNIPWVSNYIFWDLEPYKTKNKYDIFLISSIDERLKRINSIAKFAEENKLRSQITVVGKLRGEKIHPNIITTRETQSLENVKPFMEDSFCLLDLVRSGQNGLSFRPFEALALQKKLITNNTIIKDYEFYNPNNIYVLESDNLSIPKNFFTTPYEKIPKDIYEKYTLKTWVKEIFKLS